MVYTAPLRKKAFWRTFWWKGMVVLRPGPSITVSERARSMRLMASSRVGAQTMILAMRLS